MKKFYSLLLVLLMAVMSVMNMHAQEWEELTLFEGTSTNRMVPMALSECDNWTQSQHIIPANYLADLDYTKIHGIQYYVTDRSEFTSKASLQVVMWEVPATTTQLTGFLYYGQPNAFYSGQVEFVNVNGQIRANIIFDTPLEYQGGSIVIDTYNPTPSWTDDVYFYGLNISGMSWAGYNSEVGYVNGEQQNFAPMITFLYEEADSRELVANADFEGFDISSLYAGMEWTWDDAQALAQAIHPVDPDAPYRASVEMHDLYKWEDASDTRISYGTILEEGTYYWKIQIRIDGENGTLYRFPSSSEGVVDVTMNGDYWQVISAIVGEDFSFTWMYSPLFDLEQKQGMESIQPSAISIQKVLYNGQMLIVKPDGAIYTVQGQRMR